MFITLYKIINIGLHSGGQKKCNLWPKDMMFAYVQLTIFSQVLINVNRIYHKLQLMYLKF